jgi:hypothetical protein
MKKIGFLSSERRILIEKDVLPKLPEPTRYSD